MTNWGGPAQLRGVALPSSSARVFLGTGNAGSLTIELPAPVRQFSIIGTRSYFVGRGNFNGDQFDDLAVIIQDAVVAGEVAAAPNRTGTLRVIFGKAEFGKSIGSIDFANPDLSFVIDPNHVDAEIPGASVGDVTGDGIDDLILTTPEDGFPLPSSRVHIITVAQDGTLIVSAILGRSSQNPVDDAITAAGGIGDFNGDSTNDFAVVLGRAATGNRAIEIYAGGANLGQQVLLRLNFSGTGLGAISGLFPVGDLNGDGLDEFVIEHANGTEIVPGSKTLSGTQALDGLPGRPSLGSGLFVVPLGNIDNQGADDLGLTKFESTHGLTGGGPDLLHQVGQVFLGSPAAYSRWVANGLGAPDLVFEPSRSLYFPLAAFLTNARDTRLLRSLFGSPGDVNKDNRPDLVLAERLGSRTSVFFGVDGLLAPAPVPSPSGNGSTLPPEPFRFDLAAPLIGTTPSGLSGIDLTQAGLEPDIADAFGINGILAGEAISSAFSVGDINGDGYLDAIVSGAQRSYLLLGPVALDAVVDLSQIPSIRIDHQTLGKPSLTPGNVNGDQFNDLAFVRTDPAPPNGIIVSVLFGGPNMPLDLAAAVNSERGQVRTINPAFLGPVLTALPGDKSVRFLDWDGDGLSELLVSSEADAQNAPFGLLLNHDLGISAGIQTDSVSFQNDRQNHKIVAERFLRLSTQQVNSVLGNDDTRSGDVRSVSVVGDVNGDGLDDVLVSIPGFIQVGNAEANIPDVGRSYLLLGNPNTPFATGLFDAEVIFQDYSLGGESIALGDLDQDGYDDFAISRTREDGGAAPGGLFVFRGSPSIGGLMHLNFNQDIAPDQITAAFPGSQLTLNGGSASINGGRLTLNASTLSEQVLLLPQFEHEAFVLEVRLGAEPGGGSYNVGVQIGQNNIVFHPGLAGGMLRVEGPGGFTNRDVGFTPASGLGGMNRLRIESNGLGFYRITLFHPTIAGPIFVAEFTNPASLGGRIGLRREGSLGVGFFDEVTVKPRNVLPAEHAALIIHQAQAGELSGSISMVGSLQATTGDFNNDGRMDLAVGQPAIRLSDGVETGLDVRNKLNLIDQDRRGAVFVFSSVADLLSAKGQPAKRITLDEADQVIRGQFEQDQLGTLSPQPKLDLDGDDLDDLLIGAAGADVLDGLAKEEAGRVYAIYGARLPLELPGLTVPVQILTNATITGSGDFLVDRATGQAVLFPESANGASPAAAVEAFTLGAGQTETWFRFTTLGDGRAGNIIRIDTPAPTPLVADLLDANGRAYASGKAAIDLRAAPAGTYFLRVHQANNTAATQAIAFSIVIAPPAIGASHPEPDRDLALGGDGDDVLVGNRDLDRLFGQSGEDLFISEPAEALDRAPGELIGAPSAGEALSDNPRLSLDPVVALTDRGLAAALAQALGIPVTNRFDGSPRIGRPMRASQIGTLTQLNASNRAIASIAGIEAATNLVQLDLSNNPLSDLSPLAQLRRLRQLTLNDTGNLDALVKLTDLEVLSIEGTHVRDLSPLAGLAKLRQIVVRNSAVSSLWPIAGTDVVDDGDARFNISGSGWLESVNPVQSAIAEDYRFHRAGDGSSQATWRFSDLPRGRYELFLTWPAHENRASNAPFRVLSSDPEQAGVLIELGAQTLNQKFEPSGAEAGGRPWQSLGVFDIRSGDVQVELTDNADGVVAADAVRLVAQFEPLPDLQVLDLTGTPLDNVAHQIGVPLLEARRSRQPNFQFTIDSNPNAPVLAPLSPVAVLAGAPALLLLNGTDPDGGPVSFRLHSIGSGVQPRLSNNRLTIEAQPGFAGSSFVIVEALDAGGRTDQQRIDVAVGRGAIYGTQWQDQNRDGLPQLTELAIDGATVFLDANSNGQLDSSEPSTLTDANGDYRFLNLAPGRYAVAEVAQPNRISNPVADLLRAPFAANDAQGFTFAGSSNQWHLSTRRGAEAGHSRSHSLYFGSESAGTYGLRASGIAITPLLDLSGLRGPVRLDLTHFLKRNLSVVLRSQDIAQIQVVIEGQTKPVVLASSLPGVGRQPLDNTTAFQALSFDLSEFAGQKIRIAFTFQDDGGGLIIRPSVDEGWYIDDVVVTTSSSGPVTLGAGQVVLNRNFANFQVAEAGPDRQVAEGTVVTLDGQFHDPHPANGSAAIFAWAITNAAGQSVAASAQANFSFTPPDNGLFTATLTLIDTNDNNRSYTDSLDIFASNVAPVVVLGADRQMAEGTPLTLDTATVVSDPGSTDTLTFLWQVQSDNGQVIPEGTQAQFSFTPADNGNYVLTLTVIDDDGAVATDQAIITVGNAAPSGVSIGANRTVSEGSSVSLTSAFTDAGAGDTHAFRWIVEADNGQPIPPAAGRDFSFTPANDGQYVVTFAVTDDDGGSATTQVVITVTNVLPALQLSSGRDVEVGQRVTITGSFTDPGADTWRGFADFKDGVRVPLQLKADQSFEVSHVFMQAGTFDVEVALADGATGTNPARATARFVVRPFDPPPRVETASVNTGLSQRSRVDQLTVAFSENVGASLDATDLVLRHVRTGQTIPAADLAISYDATSRQARLTFPGLPGGRLSDGDYELTILAAGVTDAQGKGLPANVRLRFHVLRGDANGDRVTNDLDLYRVWQNQLKPVANRNLNDDLTGDGQVDQNDVAVVQQNYRASLDPAGRLLGGVNFDAAIGDLDLYRVWQNLLRSPGARDLAYDLNKDGQVSEEDVDIVRGNYRSPRPPVIHGLATLTAQPASRPKDWT